MWYDIAFISITSVSLGVIILWLWNQKEFTAAVVFTFALAVVLLLSQFLVASGM